MPVHREPLAGNLGKMANDFHLVLVIRVQLCYSLRGRNLLNSFCYFQREYFEKKELSAQNSSSLKK